MKTLFERLKTEHLEKLDKTALTTTAERLTEVLESNYFVSDLSLSIAFDLAMFFTGKRVIDLELINSLFHEQ